ncbi:sugar nucleotide-binding protein [Blautia schinkii]|nr:sugar nucleotide-binding protein [Blautia schinkii]
MDILILGGTGAMGIPLVDLLARNKENNLYVTSRTRYMNKENIIYLQGNAKDDIFFNSVLSRNYDVIVDFMVYDTKQLQKRLESLLNHTNQYFFFSSARCYADSKERIKESSQRLVDVCQDSEYIATDEYGLAKGREENLLKKTNRNNWTIIRPYITYNSQRIQLGVYEKENWIKRALAGRTVVLPKDIADRKTSLTYGPDVAGAIVQLIGNEKAFGEAFHITTQESYTWKEILDFYCKIIYKRTGKKIKVKIVKDSKGLQKVWNKWQIIYDRLYDREFDNSKIESFRGKYEYKPIFKGLDECLTEFLKAPKWLQMNWAYEAWCDSMAGEMTPLKDINGMKNKLIYIKWRFFAKYE